MLGPLVATVVPPLTRGLRGLSVVLSLVGLVDVVKYTTGSAVATSK
jgi:hypothetical protein